MELKIITSLLLLALTTISGHSQIRVVDQAIKVNPGATSGISPEWPTEDGDGNRNPEQVLIVVDYDGFPENEIPHTKISGNLTNPNGIANIIDASGKHLTLLYIPMEEDAINFSHPLFGGTRVKLPELKNKGIYSLTLQVDKRMNIDIEPLTDFESVKIYLDRNEEKDSPARFTNVTLGKHNLVFEFPNGRRESRTIDVTTGNGKFNEVTCPDMDMRVRIPLKIESSDRNVTIYLNGDKVADKAPFTAMLPAGNHSIKAVSNTNGRKSDIATVKIVQGSGAMSVRLTPYERCRFRITGVYEGVADVPIMLYANKEEAYKISESHAKGLQRSYEFDLPVGSKYKFRATFQGNEGSRSIKVTNNMDYEQQIKVKHRHKTVWPWEREYEAPPMGLMVAYVQKRYEVKADGETVYKGNLAAWDDAEGGNGDWLHGIKAGVQYQPTLRLGLGIYTGLFWEYYQSKTDLYDTTDSDETLGFNKYSEHSLTLPVQVLYNLPFASKVALAFHGGVSLNYMLSRNYSGYTQKAGDFKVEHSYNALKDADDLFPMYPDRFNIFWEVGLQLRIGPVMIGAQVTRPITKHKFEFEGVEYTSTAIKNSVSLTYVF